MFNYVLTYVKREKGICIILCLFSVVVSVAKVIAPYINGRFIDTLSQQPNYNNVKFFAILLCVVGGSGMILAFCSNYLSMKIINRMNYRALSELISHLEHIPFEKFWGKYNVAELTQRIFTDVSTVIGFFMGNVFQSIINIILIILLTAVLLEINVIFGGLLLFFLPIYTIAYYLFKDSLYQSSRLLKIESNIYFSSVYGELNNISNIKMEGSFKNSHNIIKNSFEKYLSLVLKNTKLMQFFSAIDTSLALLFQIVILITGGYQIVNGSMTIGEYTIINSYFLTLINYIKFYFALGKDYQNARASFIRIQELLNIAKENNGNKHSADIREIEIDNVAFKYNQKNVINIKNKLYFRQNYIYEIRGKNGSGKTTLIYILTGILQSLEKGCVKYDGCDIRFLDMYKIRRECMGVLTQSNIIPDLLVKNYLGKCKGEIIQKVNLLNIEGFFGGCDIALALNKKICELSEGERQKIFLLKVLMKNASIIILDEPTTNLDNYSIKVLIECLEFQKKNRIIIIANHDSRLEKIIDYTIHLN